MGTEGDFMVKVDNHVHSRYSFVSQTSLEDIVKAADKKGLTHVAITDRINFRDQSVNEVINRINNRNKRINTLVTPKGLTVIKGLEVCEPHLHKQELKMLSEMTDNDFILGAVHNILGVPLKKMNFYPEITNLYLSSILKMVKTADIDAVAHLDYLKKCSPDYSFDMNIVETILTEMINRGIALEINTNGIRRINDLYPSLDIIKLYLELGGRNIIYGSNAKRANEVYENIDTAHDVLSDLDLEEGYVLKRKFIRI